MSWKFLISPITSLIEGWQERRKAKLNSELQINQAKTSASIKKIMTAQEGDIAWENTSIQNAGWKDEFWTIVIALPLIMCFVPGLDGYVSAGFDVLKDSTPDWYQWMVGIAVGSAFGIKKITDVMSLKKGA